MQENTIQKHLSKFLPLYLFGLFFLAYKTTHFHHPFSIFTAFLFLVVYGFIVYTASKLLIRITKQSNFIFSSLLFLVLFFFSDFFMRLIQQSLSLYGFHNRYYLLLILLLAGILCYAEHIFFAKRARLYNTLTQVLTTFLLILTGTSLISGIQESNKKGNLPGMAFPKKKHTGIVWILMDEYASSRSLLQYFNYRNTLDTFLRQKDFILLDSIRSRSDETLFSLHAIFNNDDSLKPRDFTTALVSLEKSNWVAGLSAAGIPFVNLDFIDIGGKPKIKDLYVFPDTYLKQILYGSLIFYAESKRETMQTDDYNILVKTKLDSLLQLTPDTTGLIWAHFLIPHSPFLRKQNGQLLNEEKPLLAGPALKQQYIGYLQYGNTVIEEIIQKDTLFRNKIVVISGDHGTRFPFIVRKDWFRPFCAIHFPKGFDTTGLYKTRYISQLPGFLMR